MSGKDAIMIVSSFAVLIAHAVVDADLPTWQGAIPCERR